MRESSAGTALNEWTLVANGAMAAKRAGPRNAPMLGRAPHRDFDEHQGFIRMTPLPHSPAADRNKDAILAVLQELLPARGIALEIASGTGQHVECFAAALPACQWQPTDADAAMLPAIAVRTASLPNVRPPV